MKIALVLDDALARPDGVQEYVRAIAAYLGSRGHDVHIVCSGEAGVPPRGVKAVHSVARNLGVSFNGNSLRSPLPARISRVRALIREERFDIVHVMSPHSPLLAGRIVREARRLQGRDVRIVGTFVILPDSGTSDTGIRVLGRVLRRNVRLFDAFCGLSGPAAELATEAYGVPADAIPSPIDVAGMRSQALARPWREASDGRTVVTFLGRLVDRKGVLELVAALAALPADARERVAVRIGGRGPLADDVRRAISREGLGGHVTLDGFIADQDKAGYLAAADIAVFPATGGESFGVVLVEAMAAGAGAVLAGDNPGYSWTMGDSDAMVNPRDPEAFARALALLIDDPTRRAELHRRQQIRVSEFDSSVVGAQLELLYGLR
jgi:phosphatidylinositol alpha-mannosyltransferase